MSVVSAGVNTNKIRQGGKLKAATRNMNSSMVIGGCMLVLIVAMALISLIWTPYDAMNVVDSKLLRPSAQHWLGTDRLGYDVMSVIMAGSRTTLTVGCIAVVVAAVIGVPYGILCGMSASGMGRWLMRWNDVMQAFPPLLLAIVFTAAFGQSSVTAALALGLGASPAFARVTRSVTKQIMGREYVMASRAAGRGNLFIAARHVLPNIRGTIIVQLSVNFAVAVLAEAGLSYLGLGTPAPQASWGRLLRDSSAVIYSNWLLVLIPGIAIAWTVLAFNLLGDGLRDYLDPRLEEQS
jgi:ABC-type dipeptide/oligopeptide/nickel transport system permease subunit